MRANQAAFRFLLSYLVYMEAIATMTAFTAIYARDTLDLPMSRILVLFMLSQLTAIPGSYFLGRLADRVGSKTTVAFSLLLWLVILGLAAAASGFGLILAVALLAGVGTGGLQTVSRSFMAELTPEGREGEYFGFYAVVGRFSAVLGPVAFGAVSSATGSQRLALLLLAGLLVAALLLLRSVPSHEMRDSASAGGRSSVATPAGSNGSTGSAATAGAAGAAAGLTGEEACT
jgi:UMF1 family MFS transporter